MKTCSSLKSLVYGSGMVVYDAIESHGETINLFFFNFFVLFFGNIDHRSLPFSHVAIYSDNE